MRVSPAKTNFKKISGSRSKRRKTLSHPNPSNLRIANRTRKRNTNSCYPTTPPTRDSMITALVIKTSRSNRSKSSLLASNNSLSSSRTARSKWTSRLNQNSISKDDSKNSGSSNNSITSMINNSHNSGKTTDQRTISTTISSRDNSSKMISSTRWIATVRLFTLSQYTSSGRNPTKTKTATKINKISRLQVRLLSTIRLCPQHLPTSTTLTNPCRPPLPRSSPTSLLLLPTSSSGSQTNSIIEDCVQW